MDVLRKELTLFFIAMGFFTRIPMPTWVKVDGDSLNKANRYFGLVGVLVGALSALIYALSIQVLPVSVSILLAMMISVALTGAFHEDGLADTADGFGGGWKIADKLKIMKDSRIGTYGAVTLLLALFLKFQLLMELALYDPEMLVPALIIGHCLSRVLAASIIFTDTYVSDAYVSEEKGSKSKPLAQNQTINELLILLVTGGLALWLSGLTSTILIAASLFLLRWLLVSLFRRQIGGYTGDTLGAAQQVSELVCYLVLLAAIA
ncbi:adenosylcobinamide-GDP ribazoletransferase [Shewanella eurypsychrophilus]|uniref:Adenosylcobinamide-GDP ribazoletransferase n=1 Tax=Shewanella eurypsychrophilus TaxID=2593656 RepID=A0ABX8S2Z7_9GAMM|nr:MULTISPECIES: adenosylcobinamide-GDP ribazoletransferase [Shewanella]QFU24261.1 adenosylcobinamide-GDP ribazoletransferase [Shewanella sp. YLB-09]QXP44912.1 adenosylcobinamide-GDP ribazoletransferase [Shewanella eurypsychrophilus]